MIHTASFISLAFRSSFLPYGFRFDGASFAAVGGIRRKSGSPARPARLQYPAAAHSVVTRNHD
jgi:hypothetical protein